LASAFAESHSNSTPLIFYRRESTTDLRYVPVRGLTVAAEPRAAPVILSRQLDAPARLDGRSVLGGLI
jgi:hypothetical protein